MLRAHADQVSLWEAVMPEEVRRLSVELQRVDRLLDDEVFVTVLHPVRAVLRPEVRPAVDADGDASAVDVPEVPAQPGV